jgi:hypothetical protein
MSFCVPKSVLESVTKPSYMTCKPSKLPDKIKFIEAGDRMVFNDGRIVIIITETPFVEVPVEGFSKHMVP